MTQVTFPGGNKYSDDGSTANDMREGGHRQHMLPMIRDTITTSASTAQTAVTDAQAQALNARTFAESAASKATLAGQYADAAAASAGSIDLTNYVRRSGDTMTGNLKITVTATGPNDVVTLKDIPDMPSLDGYVKLSGGTMTGALVLSRDPVVNMEAVTKQSVDTALTVLQAALNMDIATRASQSDVNQLNAALSALNDEVIKDSGGVMVGALLVREMPEVNLEATSKGYVDSKVQNAQQAETGRILSTMRFLNGGSYGYWR